MPWYSPDYRHKLIDDMLVIEKVLALFLAALLGSPSLSGPENQVSAQRRQADPFDAGSQIVTLDGHRYRFPAYASVRYFNYPTKKAVEVGLRNSFWANILGAVAPLPNWVSVDNGVLGAHYITEPDGLFQWRLDRKAPLPPVRGPVELFSVQDGLRFWWSRDPEIAREGLLYITFDGRSDLYAECTEKDVGDETRSCDVRWFDKGVIHILWVPGNLIRSAPAMADEYRRLVKVS